MARPKSKIVTDGEVEILNVLWKRGVSTVKEVHAELVKNRKVAHTTVASMMQLMERDKGQLNLVSANRPFKYEAAMDIDTARGVAADHLVETLFAGDKAKALAFLKTHLK